MIEDTKATFDSTNLLVYLYKRRKPIIVITGLAVVISVVVSLLMQVEYKSSVVLYPAKASSVNFEEYDKANNVLAFGEDDEAEQMLQLLQSGTIRKIIIDKYNLWKHYDIDSNAVHHNSDIQETYNDRVSISRTRYGSVIIEVMDYDPDTAAFIANDISLYYDTIRNNILRQRTYPAFKIVENEYNETRNHVRFLVDTLTHLSELGVKHPSSQSLAEFTRGWANAILTKPSVVEKFQQSMKVQKKYGLIFSGFNQELNELSKHLVEIEGQYKQKKSDYTNALTGKFTVEDAFPADKKSYPVRWLIVVMSTISAFIFSIVLLITMDKLEELKKMD